MADFKQACLWLKKHKRVTRSKAWNPNLFLYLHEGVVRGHEVAGLEWAPHIDDFLAEDWELWDVSKI